MKSFRYLAQLPCHAETGSVALDLCLSARLFPSNLSYEIPPSDVEMFFSILLFLFRLRNHIENGENSTMVLQVLFVSDQEMK